MTPNFCPKWKKIGHFASDFKYVKKIKTLFSLFYLSQFSFMDFFGNYFPVVCCKINKTFSYLSTSAVALNCLSLKTYSFFLIMN